MSIDSFENIIRKKALRSELETDWQRQRATAKEFTRRFAEGSDTQLLGDQVGMGKSYVAMAVIAQSVLKGQSKALLIIPPSAVLRAKWEQEMRSFGGSYVNPDQGSLRPLVVSNYWDLIANLHDHSNAPLLRVTDGKLQCILFSLWNWARKKSWVSNHQNRWPFLDGFDEESGEALKFHSDYCIPAWEAFLEKENAERNELLKRILSPKGTLWSDPRAGLEQIKRLFKAFAENQDTFEPNVFILGMNSLRRPRRNSAETQRFAGFVLSELLRGKWEDTCKEVVKVLKKRSSVISPSFGVKNFPQFRQSNLYNTAHCVQAALAADDDLQARWIEIQHQTRAVAPEKIANFFSDLLDEVVAQKLKESNIGLAVIDEVHNWKGNAYGSSQFRESFASAVPHKLLMTATPLQMGADEIGRIFGYATSKGGKAAVLLEKIGGADGLLSACIAANDEFVESLHQLSPLEAGQLAKLDEEKLGDLRTWMNEQASSPRVTTGLANFYRRAIRYKTLVEELLALQGQIMIRHTKDQSYRSFHAGSEFRTQQKRLRNSLYATDGLWDEGHELINYMAMRLDQRLREAAVAKDGESTRAHLVRGLTSSHSAFKESRRDLRSTGAELPASVLDYLQLFERAIEHSPHPKVAATVAHAVANYRAGKKTLIFCERVSTVHEIERTIRETIKRGGAFSEAAGIRNYLIENRHLFVDVHLYRSWCKSRSANGAWSDTDLMKKATTFAWDYLRKHGASPTTRRVLRLLDLWFIRHDFLNGSRLGPAAQALAVLTDDLENDDAADTLLADAILTLQGHRAEPDETAFLRGVQEVKLVVGGESPNLWADEHSGKFDQAFWKLLDSEASMLIGGGSDAASEHRITFYRMVLDLESGLRRIALRPDFLDRLAEMPREALLGNLHNEVRVQLGSESVMQRIVRYLEALAKADGTINSTDKTNTARRSLWRGVDLGDETVVQKLDGQVPAEKRVKLCAAFNSPLALDILVCTGIGSEGIDLHRECAEIVHHDMPWNPARLEQRIGRIDRVGRVGEGSQGLVRVGVPFLAQSYDQFQYERVLGRAKLFEVLLGRPEFDLNVDEEVYGDGDLGQVRDSDGDDPSGQSSPLLPDVLAEWLRVDLSLDAIEARRARRA